MWHDDSVGDEEDVKSGDRMVRTDKYFAKATNTKCNRDAMLYNDNDTLFLFYKRQPFFELSLGSLKFFAILKLNVS